jgi:thiosulfate dehydrogenase [quinone] large subunit
MKNEEFSYLLARLPIGMSFFGHGIVRLPKLEAFSHWMAGLFDKTFLPESLVVAFGYILPILELIIGILILIGLFTRSGILLGLIVLLILIFGSSLIEQWENVFIQVMYSAYLVVLYRYLYYNRASFDHALRL